MKKKLCVVQVLLLFVCLILPYMDGMCKFYSSSPLGTYSSQSTLSLQNVLCVQMVQGEFLLYLLLIAIIAAAVFFTAQLFKESLLNTSSKATIALPACALAAGALAIFTADAYQDTFKASNGHIRYISVGIEILGWIELILLLAVVIIEYYKQYKCE